MPEKKLKVLVIEDEQIYRSLALQVFEGCEKLASPTAEDGFKKFKEFSPDITLVDIGLPDESGLDLLPKLLGYDPEAFIVMLTMSRVSSDVKLARERGASGYIIKPFTYQKVGECISNYTEYKKKLQATPLDERVGNVLAKLRVESLHEDLNRQPDEPDEDIKKHTKEKPVEILIKTWKVLFADSFLTNRERAKLKIGELGCYVDTAESGDDIINKVKREFYNIIFIDTKISGTSGYDAAAEIRRMEKYYKGEDKKTTVMIAMVDGSEDLERHFWQKAGMNDFIKKPANFTRIKDIINKHAQRFLDSMNEEYVG